MKVSGIKFVQGRNSSSDGDGKKFGVAIHNTANDASAEAEASYATRRTDKVSAHFYADSDSVVQSLDTSVEAWHAGSQQGNDNAVAVEVTGVNGWTREQWLARVAWEQLGRVLAEVCRHHGIPVRRLNADQLRAHPKAAGIYGHDDMRRAWGGTTHTDPGKNFPWDHLVAVVAGHLVDTPPATPTPPAPPAPSNWTDTIVRALPTLALGNGNKKAVRTMQAIVNMDGVGLVEDGSFGPKTDAAVRAWQVRHAVPNSVTKEHRGDGQFGRSCWTAALDM